VGRHAPVLALLLGFAACAGCGQSGSQEGSGTASCSDSKLTVAVGQPLSALNTATLRVWAGHGDTTALGSAAPGVVNASKDVRVALRANHPCRARLLKARALMLKATTELTSAAHQLKLLAAAASGGKDYSSFQSQFLADWFAGYPDFEQALTSLRAAGVPGVISTTDGKHIFTESGCAMCHTLKAAGASGSVGPDLDAVKPTKSDVVANVTSGGATMPALAGTLSAGQIRAVSDFVSQNAGK
jgi:cytochrome c6